MSTVTIGCKLPNGLVIESGYTFASGACIKLPNYKRVMLNGANSTKPASVLVAPKEFTPGITENVDEAFFDKWVADHAESNIVKNGLIFKMKNRNEATARAKDESAKTIGFEPIDTSKPHDTRTRSGIPASVTKRTDEE
jgi:hypothetical protein